VNFNQNEARDNYATNGEYRVVLPDGRTQIVTYNTADAYSGNVADVRYEGEARYPEYKPTYKPAPYQPAPAYQARLPNVEINEKSLNLLITHDCSIYFSYL
jgi:hypothetical protein